MKINENLITRIVNRQYYDRNVLAETIERNMISILLESGGISKEVVKDVEKSDYTWATNDFYKLSFKLINVDKTVFNNDEELTDLINMIGYMFYISFQGEQQGFANGLYAFLKYNNVAKNSRTVNDYCRRDQSFRLLEILRALNNYLGEVLHTNKLEDAINYINTEYNQNFTVNKLHTMCQQVERDFCKKLNRAKGEYISPNDIYESVLPKLNEYIPFIIKNNKIVCD